MDFRIDPTSGLTRRSLLAAGTTAGAAALLGVRPWTAAAAGPGYLSRSAYTGLEGTRFTVDTGAEPVALRLDSVSDVAGAASRRALAGSEDAFVLRLSGPLAAPLDSGIHTLSHPSIGTVELFASPVEAPETDRNYEIVVDRSVGAGAAHSDAPKAAEPPAPEPDPEPDAQPQKKAAPLVVRRATLRRAGRWARCELVLQSSVSAERVRCRLLRGGKVVARATKGVEDRRAVLRLEAAHPLAAGTYTLVVTAIGADGKATSQRKRVTLR
jgi:methionine-rich copper-binding protein CopC